MNKKISKLVQKLRSNKEEKQPTEKQRKVECNVMEKCDRNVNNIETIDKEKENEMKEKK